MWDASSNHRISQSSQKEVSVADRGGARDMSGANMYQIRQVDRHCLAICLSSALAGEISATLPFKIISEICAVYLTCPYEQHFTSNSCFDVSQDPFVA